ncbi:MAG: hypothetical protein RH949_12025, partial [Coleofasciculus sp. A1-SPW-01]|uniref:hypothetical protein n=1 Tax=Coleofasciculus sp. A1-SPW-01 TaxID=3070819 RepID=UPI0032F83105
LCQYSLVEDISINSRSRPLGDATKTFVSILLSRISALIRDRVSWVMPPKPLSVFPCRGYQY